MKTPKMTIIWNVLEAAKDCGDTVLISACRRLIIANRLGWKKYHDANDYSLVLEFS